MERRDLIKLSVGAALVAKTVHAQEHRFFTASEFKMVDELAEMIIPADEKSGGAKAARCAEYIDVQLAEAFDQEERDRWRHGLQWMDTVSKQKHGAAFMEATPVQRNELLTGIAANEKNPGTPDEHFFITLKRVTIRAYYTSKVGIQDDLDYKGNVLQQGDYAGELP
jgi:gluconate 2-dehydrogenase gamma chain